MTTLTLPDAQLVVVDFLRTVDEVTDRVGGQIFTKLPAGVTFPALRVKAIPGGRIRAHNTVWEARMQIDVWADGEWTASQVIRRAHAALVSVRNWRHENSDGEVCWFNGTSNVVAPGPSSDPDITDKARWLFDFHAHVRPAAPAEA